MRSRCVSAIVLAAGCWTGSLPAGQAQFVCITNNGAITITKYTGPGGDVAIPERINGLPVTSIGKSAFFGCSGVTNVTIPNGVASIGSYAFLNCPWLASVTIPGSVINVGEDLFRGCSSLIAINVDAANPSYSSVDGVLFDEGRNTLIQCPAGKAGSYSIPSGVTAIERWAFECCNLLTAIAVDAANPSYSSVDGVLFDKGQTTLVRCPGGKTGSFSIPGGVTSIEHNAFSGCYRLASVTIPSGVTSIGDNAFNSSPSLTGVYFKGNAPRFDGDASLGSGMKATIYYVPGTTGWGKEFAGRPTATWNPDTAGRTIPMPSKRLLNPRAASLGSGTPSESAAGRDPVP